MPGVLKIQTLSGCPADTVVMVLTSTAEPNGGDHYASISWTWHPIGALLRIELQVQSGGWISAPSAYLFTSIGETYTLRARGPENLAAIMSGLKFPYKVTGAYAPDWASVYGDITPVPMVMPCCVENPNWAGSSPYTSGYTNMMSAAGAHQAINYWWYTPTCYPYEVHGAAGIWNLSIEFTPDMGGTVHPEWLNMVLNKTRSVTLHDGVEDATFNATVTVVKAAGNISCLITGTIYSHADTPSADVTVPHGTEERHYDGIPLGAHCGDYSLILSLSTISTKTYWTRYCNGPTNSSLETAAGATIVARWARRSIYATMA